MYPRPQTLYTPRLCLHPLSPGDESAMVALLTNEEIAKTYMTPVFASQEEVVALFERFRLLSLDDQRLVYGIFLDERLIGFLNEVYREETAIELGYVIHPDYKGRGFAAEAFTVVIRALFCMGFRQIRAGAFEDNRASMRVMEKCGLTPTGETEIIPYRGENHRCICYAVSMEDIVGEISRMETLLDTLYQRVSEDPGVVRDDGFQESLRQLIQYYEDGRWQFHYRMDEMGLLPRDLKRGVLSEDGVYNFLSDLEK